MLIDFDKKKKNVTFAPDKSQPWANPRKEINNKMNILNSFRKARTLRLEVTMAVALWHRNASTSITIKLGSIKITTTIDKGDAILGALLTADFYYNLKRHSLGAAMCID